ncbi:MAG TPA: hypothetical protein VGM77_12820 [Gemmatimonadales bacterium]|jgi:hypothetical protein
MEMPNVVSQIKDAEHGVLYRFLAYRPLSREELVMGVRQYLSQPRLRRRKTRERNKVIAIVMTHGATADL